MARRITQRQIEILRLISSMTAYRGYPPTLREMGKALDITSTNGVSSHLRALERKGYIAREVQASRALTLTQAGLDVVGVARVRPQPGPDDIEMVEIPFFGRVAAGAPILAGDREESILVPRAILPKIQDVFALRIKGDSMTGDGILDGDIVFVKSQEDAGPGEMVVALLDGEATVKRLYREADHVRLEPSNPIHAPIVIAAEQTRNLSVAGVVVGLFRKV